MQHSNFAAHLSAVAGTASPRELHTSIMPRPFLTALVDAGAAAPLCIIRGPLNSGKSVALQQWSQTTDRVLLWLHLNQATHTPEQFWLKMRHAIGTHLNVATELQHDEEFKNDPALYLSAMVSTSGPFTLILENYRWAHGTGVEPGILELLGHAPQLSIIVVTRLSLSVERQQLSSEVKFQVIGPADLQFSAEEAATYHAGTPLEQISAELNEQLQGVPILHQAARGATATTRTRSLPLLEDIVQQVANLLEPDLVHSLVEFGTDGTSEFIATTLPLVNFDVELAQLVAPDSAVPDMIQKLAETGLLSSVEDARGIRFSYPPLVKRTYGVHLGAEIESAKKTTLTTAAGLEFARNAHELAFVYAVQNGEFRWASSMMIRSGLDLLVEGNSGFAAALKSIPHTQLAKYPVLALALGLMFNVGKTTRTRGLEYFALALASSKIQGRGLPTEERLALGLTQALALRLTGQFKLAATTARASLKVLSELSLVDRDGLSLFESVALSHWGLCLLFTGDYTGATRALHLSVSSAQRFDSDQPAFFSVSLLAYIHALEGDLDIAEEFASAAQQMSPNMPAIDLYQRTPLHMALALIELGRLNPDGAARHIKPVMSEASTSEFWGQLRIIEARIDLLRGHAGVALARLDTATARRKDLPALNPLDGAVLSVVRAELLLASRNASGAMSALATLPARSSAGKVAKARISLSMHRPEEVVELLGGPLPADTAQLALTAQILLTVALLHLQPLESARADVERISGTLSVLPTLWPLAMLTQGDLELLQDSTRRLGIPCPSLKEVREGVFPDSLSMIELTPREASILATLVTTEDRADIARLHFVSLNTVKSQLRTLYKKLNVSSREEALLVAHREHLL